MIDVDDVLGTNVHFTPCGEAVAVERGSDFSA
jgi:hypothetical protein